MAEKRLEHEIDDLVQLSEIRAEAEKWRDQGRRALEKFCSGDTSVVWAQGLDYSGRAVIIKALSSSYTKRELLDEQVKELKKLRAGDILGDGERSPLFVSTSDKIPYLDAALALQALASARNGAFTPATMLFYYIVVRELYDASSPEWSVGGARSGPGGPPTAFATTEFLRGILTFARTLERTARYARVLAELDYSIADVDDASAEARKAWLERDRERRLLSLKTTLAQNSWNLAVAMDEPIPDKLDDVRAIDFVREKFVASIRLALDAFKTAQADILKFREQEERSAATSEIRRRLVARSAGAHSIAAGAIADAVDRATAACALFPTGDDLRMKLADSEADKQRVVLLRRRECSDRLRELEKHFKAAQTAVEKLIRPAVNFFSAVLDGELAKAAARAGSVSAFEPAELAAAAASYGMAQNAWERDQRLLLAANYLAEAASERGFLVAQPYHIGPGAYYTPAQPPILRSFVQILENVKAFELTPTVAKRIRTYFDTYRHELIGTEPAIATWRWDYTRDLEPHDPSYTASSVVALDHFVRALDRRINDSVLNYFTHSQPKKLKLHDLFYPDYGLAVEGRNLDNPNRPRRNSIALRLERMRAHVAGIPVDSGDGRAFYSIVLHGPPGTGKTTLIEALAASAGVPIVEVTPSDIVVRGTDAIEERAGAVLKALSLLTNVVILFDEFDPVVAVRESGARTSVFTFLAAGMLPKLKRLYESAKQRRIAYALVTNLVSGIEPAAIRAGRFDAMVGVYPPDLLSRYSRLLVELQAWDLEYDWKDPAVKRRIGDVVRATAGGPMQELGKPGWFTRPSGGRDRLAPGTAFAYVFGKSPHLDTPTREQWPREKMSGDEIRDMGLIESWDQPPTEKSPEWHRKIWKEITAQSSEEESFVDRRSTPRDDALPEAMKARLSLEESAEPPTKKPHSRTKGAPKRPPAT